VSDPYAQQPRPSDEPPSQPFQPMSYDLSPEYSTPPQQPPQPPPYYPAGPDPYAQQPYADQPPYPGAPASGAPYPGQPASGVPYPEPSSYGAPAYGPPAQPGYDPNFGPPPAYGAPPGYPGAPGMPGLAPPPPPKKKRTGLKVTLGIVAAVIVVCGIASCAIGYPILSQQGATVSAPQELPGNLVKDADDEMQSTIDGLEKQLKSDLNADQVAAAFYKDTQDDTRPVLLVAATTLILQPEKELNSAFKGINSSDLQISNITKYDAGKLGGYLKCGGGKTSDIDVAACVWTDHGSAGIAFFFKRTVDDSAALFRQIRETVEKR
jgi:hypothetical protein